MGLDMYLRKEVHLRNYGPSIFNITVEKDGEPYLEDGVKVLSIITSVAQWRKANAIHKFFIDKRIDDCRSFIVPVDSVVVLRHYCRRILADPSLAVELLPTKNGFFFGSTEYDESYFNILEETMMILDKSLLSFDPDYDEYIYEASW